MRRVAELSARHSTGIDLATVAQRTPRILVHGAPLRLEHGALRPSHTEPREILDGPLGPLRTTAQRIEILDAEHEVSSRFLGASCRRDEGARVADVQIPRRRRSDPAAVRHVRGPACASARPPPRSALPSAGAATGSPATPA